VSLCDIHPIDVRGWHGELSRGVLHQNTIAKIYRLFRTIMSSAVEDDLLRQNPVRIKGASAEQMIERPLLTWDDVRALAGAIHPRFECLVWTAAASGLRFEELAGLSVDHVNLDRSELRVSHPRAPIHQHVRKASARAPGLARSSRRWSEVKALNHRSLDLKPSGATRLMGSLSA
jgi:integrase